MSYLLTSFTHLWHLFLIRSYCKQKSLLHNNASKAQTFACVKNKSIVLICSSNHSKFAFQCAPRLAKIKIGSCHKFRIGSERKDYTEERNATQYQLGRTNERDSFKIPCPIRCFYQMKEILNNASKQNFFHAYHCLMLKYFASKQIQAKTSHMTENTNRKRQNLILLLVAIGILMKQCFYKEFSAQIILNYLIYLVLNSTIVVLHRKKLNEWKTFKRNNSIDNI